MDIKEREFNNGTLLYMPFEGGELGMFVGMPDRPQDVNHRDGKPVEEGLVMVGSPLDFVVRKTPAGDWDPAPKELCESINEVIVSMEETQAKAPIGRNEGAADGMWTPTAIHRTILAFMKRALTTFVTKRLN